MVKQSTSSGRVHDNSVRLFCFSTFPHITQYPTNYIDVIFRFHMKIRFYKKKKKLLFNPIVHYDVLRKNCLNVKNRIVTIEK